jgi:hypothetical protein
MSQALDFVDLRLVEMNMRMLEAYKLREYFQPEVWQKVVAILDILAGRQDVTIVKQRWEDSAEETRELEVMRQVAYAEKQNGVADAQMYEVCEECGEQHGYHTSRCGL